MPRTRTVTMTKAQVIEAIEVETNLQAGLWINLPHHTEPNEINCDVCAVGALLWGAGVPPKKIEHVAMSLLRQGGPLLRLSNAFEATYWTSLDIEKARKAAIRHVKNRFPPKISFKYNGETVWL